VTDVMTKRLLTLDKVTVALGCSIYSVRRYIANGSIKAVNIGSRVMVSTEEVERIQRDGLTSIPLPKNTPKTTETAPVAPRRAFGRGTRGARASRN
jgi:hypothetical protein